MKIRLNRKFAQAINGIDLSRAQAGQDLVLPLREARMLIAEGWATPLDGANDKPKRKQPARKRPAARD